MDTTYFRHELRLLYLAFTKYKRGFLYLYMRFVVAMRIMHHAFALSRPKNAEDVSVHFLTGARDFTMALWSLASFYRYSTFVPTVYFHTDGTLNVKQRKIVERLFPHVTYIDGKTVDREYAKTLSGLPLFLEFKKMFPGFQSKKLVDTFLVAPCAYQFVFDSDLLWFRDPVELRRAFESGHSIMMDGGGGLCPQRFTDGTQTSDFISNLNSGVVGFQKKSFSFSTFSEYLKKLDLTYTHHFVEQAAFGVCLPEVTLLPLSTYILKGELTSEIVMRHYTSPTRAKFFLQGLPHVAKDILFPPKP